eukprot:CAMPEP_0176469934 /NCGR_PEP_ID=MMETSP0127-20121128/40167_1 /TAXON_ID=938130 /ORGANISM="Platyophrya macrostoma, Strain WH" /LENGTH=863 /DNA_ID=CAMNT_0017864155 /DNA_START=190 /DNA_END=2781 /DNA_ORIENTATION=+
MEGKEYGGKVIANFELGSVSKDIFIDCGVQKLHKVTVNGNVIDSKNDYHYLRNDRFLMIPPDALKQGTNIVDIEFENNYSNDGNGLHSFVDTDGLQYLYSNCEPYRANQMLPCFDQPDLKGSLKLTVAAPKSWSIISHTAATEGVQHEAFKNNKIIKHLDGSKTKCLSFDSTQKISSYLFTIVAGPYVEIKAKELYQGIPMSLYSRASLNNFLKEQAEEIFEITRANMKFYEDFFGYPYPFSKYDQIFCPEYNMGAMENPGCVTLNDLYIFKEKATVQQRSGRANTIVHELAHMWFGDLVTMKWWDDLWLNESFAEFISHLAMARTRDRMKTIKYSDVWLDFFRRKEWAYRDDQLDTTHPIYGEVKSTEEAETIFDGITYAKGAATLKQLTCLIGEDNFSNAMKTYFKKYEWSNATLKDFMDCMQLNYEPLSVEYPASLDLWQKQWIQTAGPNELSVAWDPSNKDKKAKMTIHQKAVLPQHPTLRIHKMKVAFFNEQGMIYDRIDVVVPDKESVEVTYDGSENPKAILLNFQDEAYAKIKIDENSKKFFMKHLSEIPDEFTRALIWRTFFDMVRDGNMSSLDLVELGGKALLTEKGDSLLNSIFGYLTGAIENFTPLKLRKFLNSELFELTKRLLMNTEASQSNRVVVLRDKMISFASNSGHINFLLDWFDGKVAELHKHPIGLNNRWSIVKKLHENDDFDSGKRIIYLEKAKEADPTDTVKKVEKMIEGLSVSKAKRGEMWKGFLKQGQDSVHLSGNLMSGFNSVSRLEELKPYHDEFFNVVMEVFRTEGREYAKTFYGSLFPSGDEIEDYLRKTNQLLAKADPEKEAWLVKILKTKADDLRRKLKAYDCVMRSIRSTQEKH